MNYGTCTSCGTDLIQRRGYAGTGLCGPCCTGEADTIGETCESEYEHENTRKAKATKTKKGKK